jgi:hypothetical protein
MSYDVTYDEYKKRLELKNKIVDVLKEAREKLLRSTIKPFGEPPSIQSPNEVLNTITKIEKLINKINLDNQDDSIA